ncbi:MAG: hypothetical protein HOQ02_02480 [Lysobacter sp.]|nr:hypothetical protein [Lysobacter sp.]
MTDFGKGAAAAVQFVSEAQEKFGSRGDQLLVQAQAQLDSLAHFTVSPTTFSVNFDFANQLTPFQRPVAPTLNSDDFALQPQEQPGLPPAFEAQTPDLDPLPVFDIQEPTFAYGPRPTRPDMARPTAPARPAPLAPPAEPDYTQYAPAPITLLDLRLPVLPDLQLPTFTSARPTIAPFAINDNFTFTPEAYVSALLDKIRGRVSSWMDGEDPLPPAIRRALFERGRQRIVVEQAAAEDQAFDDFAARGFSQPPGMLVARVDAIRQKAQDQVGDLNRELTIKDYETVLENMRLAVQSGIQLEGITINLHLERQRLLLASAQFLRETSIAILNARITQFNAEMQGYGIDAQVLETRLKAELAKLDQYRAQIEAEKLKGDVNEQSVRLYQAQWEAVRTLADFYRSRVEAVKVQADANRIPIEIFSEEVKAYDTLFSAYGKEWDGYRASIEGEGAKATLYRAMVDAFGTRTDGIVKYGGLKNDLERLRLAEHQQNLSVYDAGLRRLGQLLDTERTRLTAAGTRAAAEATIYRARADVEQAASAATDRTFQLGLEASKARVDTQIEAARIRSSENIALQNLLAEIAKALAQIHAQLAASSMSAINYGANVSASDSYGHSLSASWSGDAPDYTGLTTTG